MRKLPITLLGGDAHPQLSEDIARLLGVPFAPVTVSTFADGETRVRVDADVQDADLYVVQPTPPPTNERLMALALVADAARGAGAQRITAVVPYFGYARQDVRKTLGEPRSARLAASFLANAGIDRVVTVELHSPALESAFEIPVVQLQADEATLPTVRNWQIDDLTIVSPDAGGLKRAQRYASLLNAPVAVIAKTRPTADVAVPLQVLGAVAGRNCLLVDDLASTGRTIVGAAHALLAAGAKEVHALFIHAVMAPEALERICAAPIGHIATTDSVPIKAHPRLELISLAPLLARTVSMLSSSARRSSQGDCG
jgi:ribose-phosphate pyrophosphokinase